MNNSCSLCISVSQFKIQICQKCAIVNARRRIRKRITSEKINSSFSTISDQLRKKNRSATNIIKKLKHKKILSDFSNIELYKASIATVKIETEDKTAVTPIMITSMIKVKALEALANAKAAVLLKIKALDVADNDFISELHSRPM